LAARLAPKLSKSNALNPRDISRQPSVVAAYTSDPLVHDRVSMLLGNEMLVRAKTLLDQVQAVSVPLLVMHGDADNICHVDGSRKFVHQAVSDVQLRIWPGCYHELHNEPEAEEVLAYAKTWLDSAITH
jgi:alpha-beta hydrolase superfamily lysophospholipase